MQRENGEGSWRQKQTGTQRSKKTKGKKISLPGVSRESRGSVRIGKKEKGGEMKRVRGGGRKKMRQNVLNLLMPLSRQKAKAHNMMGTRKNKTGSVANERWVKGQRSFK